MHIQLNIGLKMLCLHSDEDCKAWTIHVYWRHICNIVWQKQGGGGAPEHIYMFVR